MSGTVVTVRETWVTVDGVQMVHAKRPDGLFACFSVPRRFDVGTSLRAERIGDGWRFVAAMNAEGP